MKLSSRLFLFFAVLACSSLFPVVSVGADSYDYVVVGGGTAGCVVAARLSENPSVNVLLLESGHDNTDQGTDFTGTEPAIFPGYRFPDTQGPNIIPMRSRESNPGSFTPNHYVPIPRTLGGGSSVNGQCYSRLSADDWAYFNVSGWSYADVLPFQKRVETYNPYDPSAMSSARGTKGPVSVTTYAPGDLTSSLMASASSILGLPQLSDLDAGNAHGVSQFGRNSKPGTNYTRESSWIAYLKPILDSRNNLDVITDSIVTSIAWKTRSMRGVKQIVYPLVAVGVYYTTNSLPGVTSQYVKVNEELILSAGVMNNPKLLMLSGIGPKDHLAAKGITLALASERVGQNLRDHMSLPTMVYLMKDAVVSDRVILGAFGSTGVQSSSLANFSDYEIATVQVQNGIPLSATLVVSAVAAIPVLTRNSARGTVQLLDSNPTSNQIINFNAFASPLDAQALAWLANATRAIFTQTPGFIAESSPGFAKIPLNSPLSAWSSWFASTAPYGGAKSYFHFVGTCSMGTSIDNGVIDSKLKLFGATNVRVADLSVLPKTTGQRPFATSMLIGERVANFILTGQ